MSTVNQPVNAFKSKPVYQVVVRPVGKMKYEDDDGPPIIGTAVAEYKTLAKTYYVVATSYSDAERRILDRIDTKKQHIVEISILDATDFVIE